MTQILLVVIVVWLWIGNGTHWGEARCCILGQDMGKYRQ